MSFRRISAAALIASFLWAAPSVFSQSPDTATADTTAAARADTSTEKTAAGQAERADTAGSDTALRELGKSRSGEGAGEPLDLDYEEPDSVFSLGNISVVLIVIGLLILFLHLLRKFVMRPLGGNAPADDFQVIRQFHLGPKKTVTLVKFVDRLLVLGVTDSNITKLAEIDDPDEVRRITTRVDKTGRESGGGFKEIYQNLLSRDKSGKS